jgi:hypothetical protein
MTLFFASVILTKPKQGQRERAFDDVWELLHTLLTVGLLYNIGSLTMLTAYEVFFVCKIALMRNYKLDIHVPELAFMARGMCTASFIPKTTNWCSFLCFHECCGERCQGRYAEVGVFRVRAVAGSLALVSSYTVVVKKLGRVTGSPA